MDIQSERARILGVEIDRLTMAETLARCTELIESRGFAQHVAINAAKLVSAGEDPELREIIRQCELVTADGQSVVWASRLLGDPLPERVAGIDLMNNLLGLAAERGYRVFILGARRDVLARAIEILEQRHPGLVIAGSRDGYFPPGEDAAVAEEVRRSGADLLFVAMSSPRKEQWLARHGRGAGIAFVMGVGGAIDVVAGVTRRAPRLLQVAGLEWSYRLMQEPRRLFGRYWRTNTRFIALVVREMLRRRRRSEDPPAQEPVLRDSSNAL